MAVVVDDPWGPAGESEVQEVERELQVRLPESYRAWLLRVGGGELAKEVLIPHTGGNGYLTQLDEVGDLLEYQDMEGTSNAPKHYLIITIGHGGCLALRVANGDEGSVWWVDTDKAGILQVGDRTEDVMIRIADTFDDFLQLPSVPD